MADAYIGEIRVFGGNFAPKGWAFCNGALMSISQYTALFSILGVQYGGDGKTTFALPNLMGKAPMGQGAGPGLTPRTVGSQVGSESVTLDSSEIPAHTHTPMAISVAQNTADPTNAYWAEAPATRFGQAKNYGPTPNTPMAADALEITGNNQGHNNMQPYLAMNYIICLNGLFPSRG